MLGLKFPTHTREHTQSWYAATANYGGNYPILDGEQHTDVAVVARAALMVVVADTVAQTVHI